MDVPLEIAAVGTVEPIASVEVKARVSGQIAAVAFQEGADVRKGQLLFRINPDMLQRQVTEQQAEIARDEAAAQQARQLEARDASTARQSEADAGIAEKLLQIGVISGQRAAQLASTGASEASNLQADHSAASSAASAVEADRARLAQTRLQLQLSEVTAPISGRTGAVLARVGDMVTAQQTALVQLLQMAPLDVSFGIPEQQFPEVQRLSAAGALTVEATVNGTAPAQGSLSFLDNTIDTATGTVRLKASFANRDGRLWPGQFVNVRMRLRVDAAQTIVPVAAVQSAEDGSYVWVLRHGAVHMQPVAVRRIYSPPRGGEWAVIARGVAPGTPVITEGQLRLTEGSPVELLAQATAIAR